MGKYFSFKSNTNCLLMKHVDKVWSLIFTRDLGRRSISLGQHRRLFLLYFTIRN